MGPTADVHEDEPATSRRDGVAAARRYTEEDAQEKRGKTQRADDAQKEPAAQAQTPAPQPAQISNRRTGFDRNTTGAPIPAASLGGSMVPSNCIPAQQRHVGPMTGAAASRIFRAPADKSAGGHGCCVFVGHLLPGVTEMHVVEGFKMFGPIVACRPFPHENYCLIQYTNPQHAEMAVRTMHTRVFWGGSINVKKSHHTMVR